MCWARPNCDELHWYSLPIVQRNGSQRTIIGRYRRTQRFYPRLSEWIPPLTQSIFWLAHGIVLLVHGLRGSSSDLSVFLVREPWSGAWTFLSISVCGKSQQRVEFHPPTLWFHPKCSCSQIDHLRWDWNLDRSRFHRWLCSYYPHGQVYLHQLESCTFLQLFVATTYDSLRLSVFSVLSTILGISRFTNSCSLLCRPRHSQSFPEKVSLLGPCLSTLQCQNSAS